MGSCCINQRRVAEWGVLPWACVDRGEQDEGAVFRRVRCRRMNECKRELAEKNKTLRKAGESNYQQVRTGVQQAVADIYAFFCLVVELYRRPQTPEGTIDRYCQPLSILQSF